MAILVFANGELIELEWISPYLKDEAIIIAADGGVHHLLNMEIMPNVLIGDLDSADSIAIEKVKAAGTTIVRHPPDKDETDLELALLWATERYQEDIIVFGALGGRLDHSLGNLMLLAHPKLAGRRVEIRERDQKAWLISDESQIDGSAGDLVSFIPLGLGVLVRETAGLSWPLSNEKLVFGLTRGISNVMTGDKAWIALESGQLLCVHISQGADLQ